MAEKVIEIKSLKKMYGKDPGVIDLNLDVFKGETMGFLGPNGAGKTTTIRCCMDLISKTSGEIRIFGMDSHRDSVKIRKKTGYLPGDFDLIPNVKVLSLLKYLLSLSGCRSTKKMERLSDRFDLNIKRKTNELSKGNRQKFGIVQAFMADQELIILDEATSGLDPLMQQEFHRLIREEKANGKTIFMSSHILSDVETVCERVAIIKDWRLQVVEKISTLQDKMGKVLEVEFVETVDVNEFKLPGVNDIQQEGRRLTLTVHENLDTVIKTVSNHKIVNMNLKTYSLEKLFLRYYMDGAGHKKTGGKRDGG